MESFDRHGHLTDAALTALVRGDEALDELTRLELAEHLAFCDRCLERYTETLAEADLLTPEHTCRETLWGRVRARTLRLITSRYATAAAAVALALTMLWGGRLLPDRALPPEGETPLPERIEETVTAWAQWPRALTEALSGLTDFLDHPGAPAPAEQGGHQP